MSLLHAKPGESVWRTGFEKSLLLAAFPTLLLALSVGCSPPTASAPAAPPAPVLTFLSSPQAHHQRETVSVKVEPALGPKELVQIWIRANDNVWYPCTSPAKHDAASGAWSAVCQFGNEQHPVPPGTQLLFGAFYTSAPVNMEFLPDSLWSLIKTQQTTPVVFSPGN